MNRQPLGTTSLVVPPIIFGTSCLGNLYEALPWETKLAILREMVAHVPAPVVLDTAGKYGAGLALEIIGRGLRELDVSPAQVIISNKLGWQRVPLRGSEPTFERGVWAGLEHDAEQLISYGGIRKCFEQGCELLGGVYRPQVVSVHDPDEYLAAGDRRQRKQDILEAYRALSELKQQGVVAAVGVGSKDWTIIRELAGNVALDWVMLACSLTILRHPPELLNYVAELNRRKISIINSAVFHAGFLTGGKFFDYRIPQLPADQALFDWRESFQRVCRTHAVAPATACVQFALSPPGVISVALNTSQPDHVRRNVALVQTKIPEEFWTDLKQEKLIASDYPYL